jgi:branched-chain amino acid transport system substrate-binding protein
MNADANLTRRTFLERATLVLGGATVLPVLGACGGESGGEGGAETMTGGGARAQEVVGEIKIGLLLPFTGSFASLGRDQERGVELFLAQNENIVGGLETTLVKEDSQGDPAVGLQKAQKLVQSDRVDLTIGIISSAVALAVKSFFDTNQQLLLISNAGANEVTTQNFSEYVFRSSYSSFQNSYPLGRWAAEELGTSAILTYSDYTGGHDLSDGFKQGFGEAGGSVVAEVPTPLGTTDYAPFLSGLASRGGDFVWAFQPGTDAVNMVKQYDQFGLKETLPLIGNGAITSEEVLAAQGRAALGIRTNFPYAHTLESAENRPFVEAYRDRYAGANPSLFSVCAYDAMLMLDAGLRATGGEKDAEQLIGALEGVEVDSPRGSLQIEPDTHNPIQPEYLFEVQETDEGLANVPLLILGRYADQEQISGQEDL